MQTVFEIFGIENKETKVSNYFAFLIGENRAFLKMLCDMAGIALDDGEVFVDREFLFTLDGYDNKRNYIDILVRVGDQSAPSQIICIENKIYASEGYKQTERYKKGMEKCFPKARKNYIYLTKNNSYINLSSIDFVQIKFFELAQEMKKRELLSLPFLHDFYDYYYERDEKRFTEYYRNNTVLSSDDFIDYLLWNARKMNGLYVKDGKSSKSKNRFYQISKSNWIPKQHIKDKKGTDIELSIHLESASNDRAVLHFETDPYIKFRGLKQKFGEKFLDEYIRMRNSYRKHFADRTEKLADSYHLTLARFKLPKKIGCNDRIKELFELIAYIDDAFV